jgi:hypothetical protein
MTITVSLHNGEQEKVLIEFLEKMHFDYQSDIENNDLTESKKKQILKRDNDFLNEKTTARDWNDIKRDLKNVYCSIIT